MTTIKRTINTIFGDMSRIEARVNAHAQQWMDTYNARSQWAVRYKR